MQGDPAPANKPQVQSCYAGHCEVFSEKLPQLHAIIHDTIVDVGFGFGKTLEHNYQLLRELRLFQLLGRPILSGVSKRA